MTERPISFAPGPTELHPRVRDELRAMSLDGYLSASHRSAEVRREIARMSEALRSLLGVPPESRILLVGSATEAMERIVDGVVDSNSLHFVNGAFSGRFQKVAATLGVRAEAVVRPEGEGFTASDASVLDSGDAPPDLFALTQNETATGVRIPPEDVHALADVARAHGALVACDLVTGWPAEPVDPARIDAGFFSVQKGFGLPPGLGVIIASEALVERARARRARGARLGGVLHLAALADVADRGETVATPNTLAIRLLARVAEQLAEDGGQSKLTKETTEASTAFWETLRHVQRGAAPVILHPFVRDPRLQSRTVSVVSVTGPDPAPPSGWAGELRRGLLERGFEVGSGYGVWGPRHIRVANFPVHAAPAQEALRRALAESLAQVNAKLRG
jgi:phosphoserine aminotransferase